MSNDIEHSVLVLNARPLWIRLLFRGLGRFVPTTGVVFHSNGTHQPVSERELPHAPGWSLQQVVIPKRSLGRLASMHSYGLHRRLTKRFGKPRSAVFTQPSQRALCARFAGVQRIYYAADDYRWDYGWRAEDVQAWEHEIAGNVDRIVCVSHALAESMARRLGVPDEKFFVSANGMPESIVPHRRDARTFEALHVQMPGRRPTAGVFGTISKRIRLDWLRALLDALTWLNLVLVGPKEELDAAQQNDLAYLTGHPRCTVIDRVDYYDLFRYATNVQIGLLPLANNGINPTSSPVRFYTQLPFGQPIVATESSLQLREFEPLVTIVRTLPEFIQTVAELKRIEFDDRLAETRRMTARQHTWEKRAESLFSELISSG